MLPYFVFIVVFYFQIRTAVPPLVGMAFGPKVMWEMN